MLDKPDFILGAGSDSGVPLGAMFEVLTALGGVVTAVALYSVARRHSERGALGFVTTRVMEAAMIFVGVLAIMATYTLRNDVAGTAGADAGALDTTGQALVAIHDWTFLLGPGLMAGLNALLIGSIMYRSRLLPRWIPTLGLIGAPLLLISVTATLFGVWDQISGPAAVPRPPDRRLGVLLRRLHDLQGLQAHSGERPLVRPQFATLRRGRRLTSLIDPQSHPAPRDDSVPWRSSICADTTAIIRLRRPAAW